MAMLKRKRSDSELSFSSSTTLSSPSRPSTNFSFSSPSMVDQESVASAMFRGFRAPTHLNSRTMKRTRNGRPSDAEVHERTLGLLYAAQESSHDQLAATEEQASQHDDSTNDTPPTAQNNDTYTSTNQPSLYSFWKIARPAQRKSQPLVAPVAAGLGDGDHCMSDDM